MGKKQNRNTPEVSVWQFFTWQSLPAKPAVGVHSGLSTLSFKVFTNKFRILALASAFNSQNHRELQTHSARPCPGAWPNAQAMAVQRGSNCTQTWEQPSPTHKGTCVGQTCDLGTKLNVKRGTLLSCEKPNRSWGGKTKTKNQHSKYHHQRKGTDLRFSLRMFKGCLLTSKYWRQILPCRPSYWVLSFFLTSSENTCLEIRKQRDTR